MKIYYSSFLLLVISVLIFANSGYSQEKIYNNSLNFKLGIPIALSGYTFKTYWCPSIDVDIVGMKRCYKHLYAGLSFDYSLFHCRWIHQLRSSINIINPNISVGFDIFFIRRFRGFSDLSLGYSWMIFTNPVTPSKYMRPYNESGFSVKPGLSLFYLFRNNFSIGITGYCKTIFTRFGNDDIILYEGKKEADYTSSLNTCICFGKYF